MDKKCEKCGKPASSNFIRGWTMYNKEGEVGGWDSVECDDIEIHLCDEHAKQFGNDMQFRMEIVSLFENYY